MACFNPSAIWWRSGLALALAYASGCSSPAIITLDSAPTKAEIYTSRLGAGPPVLAGTTPLVKTAAELEKTYQGSGPILFEFRKPGFRTMSTLVTDLGSVTTTVKVDLPPVTGSEDQDRLNAAIDSLFESQRLAKLKRYPEALERTQKIILEIPVLAAAYEIQGGIQYLQKDYQKAYDSFELAVKYNSKNPESLKMRKLLEDSLGVRKAGKTDAK